MDDYYAARSGLIPPLPWPTFSPPFSIKAAITGTYRSISAKHLSRYLAEFEYRLNRRYDLGAMIPRLAWASVRTPPMPYRRLKLAEVHA